MIETIRQIVTRERSNARRAKQESDLPPSYTVNKPTADEIERDKVSQLESREADLIRRGDLAAANLHGAQQRMQSLARLVDGSEFSVVETRIQNLQRQVIEADALLDGTELVGGLLDTIQEIAALRELLKVRKERLANLAARHKQAKASVDRFHDEVESVQRELAPVQQAARAFCEKQER